MLGTEFSSPLGMLGAWSDPRPREACGVGTKVDKVELTTMEMRCTADTLVVKLESMTSKKWVIEFMEATVGSAKMRKALRQTIKEESDAFADTDGKRGADEMLRTLDLNTSAVPPAFVHELDEAKRLLAALDMVDIDVGFMYYHEGKNPLCGGARARYCCQTIDADGRPSGTPDLPLMRALAQRMVDKCDVTLTVDRTPMGGSLSLSLSLSRARARSL